MKLISVNLNDVFSFQFKMKNSCRIDLISYYTCFCFTRLHFEHIYLIQNNKIIKLPFSGPQESNHSEDDEQNQADNTDQSVQPWMKRTCLHHHNTLGYIILDVINHSSTKTSSAIQKHCAKVSSQ